MANEPSRPPTCLDRDWQRKCDDFATEVCFRVGHGYELMTVQRDDGNPAVVVHWHRYMVYYSLETAQNAVARKPKPQHFYISTTRCNQFMG